MGHNQSWTGRGAFEQPAWAQSGDVSPCHLDRDVKLAAQVCRLLAPMPSTVEQLLLEDGQMSRIQYFELNTVLVARCGMIYLGYSTTSKLFVFACRFVDALKRSSLQPDDEG
jgi:hypothetical protein